MKTIKRASVKRSWREKASAYHIQVSYLLAAVVVFAQFHFIPPKSDGIRVRCWDESCVSIGVLIEAEIAMTRRTTRWRGREVRCAHTEPWGAPRWADTMVEVPPPPLVYNHITKPREILVSEVVTGTGNVLNQRGQSEMSRKMIVFQQKLNWSAVAAKCQINTRLTLHHQVARFKAVDVHSALMV